MGGGTDGTGAAGGNAKDGMAAGVFVSQANQEPKRVTRRAVNHSRREGPSFMAIPLKIPSRVRFFDPEGEARGSVAATPDASSPCFLFSEISFQCKLAEGRKGGTHTPTSVNSGGRTPLPSDP